MFGFKKFKKELEESKEKVKKLEMELSIEKEFREIDKGRIMELKIQNEEFEKEIKDQQLLALSANLIEKITIALFSHLECTINFTNAREEYGEKVCDITICIPNLKEKIYNYEGIRECYINNVVKNYGYYFYIDNNKCFLYNRQHEHSENNIKYVDTIFE